MLKADILQQLDQQRIIAWVRIESATQLVEIGTILRRVEQRKRGPAA